MGLNAVSFQREYGIPIENFSAGQLNRVSADGSWNDLRGLRKSLEASSQTKAGVGQTLAATNSSDVIDPAARKEDYASQNVWQKRMVEERKLASSINELASMGLGDAGLNKALALQVSEILDRMGLDAVSFTCEIGFPLSKLSGGEIARLSGAEWKGIAAFRDTFVAAQPEQGPGISAKTLRADGLPRTYVPRTELDDNLAQAVWLDENAVEEKFESASEWAFKDEPAVLALGKEWRELHSSYDEERNPRFRTPDEAGEKGQALPAAPNPAFYSHIEKTIEEKMPNVAPIGQVFSILANNSNGVKLDEIPARNTCMPSSRSPEKIPSPHSPQRLNRFAWKLSVPFEVKQTRIKMGKAQIPRQPVPLIMWRSTFFGLDRSKTIILRSENSNQS